MKGKLIVIEGLDGSGKSTQEETLKQRFSQRNIDINYKLPNYGDPPVSPSKCIRQIRQKAHDVNICGECFLCR